MTADTQEARFRTALAAIRDASRITWTRCPSADECVVADAVATLADPVYVPTEAGLLAEAYRTLVADLEELHEVRRDVGDPGWYCRHCDTSVSTDPRDRCATIRLVHGRP